MTKLQTEQISKLKEKYENGATLKELSKEFSVGAMTVRNKLMENGVVIRPRGRKKKNAI